MKTTQNQISRHNVFEAWKRCNPFFIIGLLAYISCLSASNAASVVKSTDIVVQFDLVAEKISLNEPVLMNLVIKNNSQQPFQFILGTDGVEAIQLSIRQTHDEAFKAYQIFVPDGTSRISLPVIQPGGFYRDIIIANKWYSFDTAGHYQIKPQVIGISYYPAKQLQHVVNQVMNLIITPRDPERLKQRANELLASELNNSLVTFTQAADMLSYFNDPVALPAFEQILARRYSMGRQGIAKKNIIKGLSRRTDLPAVELLIKYLGKLDRMSNYHIKSALWDIVKNPATDKKIVTLAKSARTKYSNSPQGKKDERRDWVGNL
jgi:hypothetical protein